MSLTIGKRVAAISMARNDDFFIRKWVDYYGSQLGKENLFLILDGHDQPIIDAMHGINVIRVPHVKFNRSQGDRNRARMVSYFGKGLFKRYHMVIAHDIDEALVVDPKVGMSLVEYISALPKKASFSALGLDVGQHIKLEHPIDPHKPFLEQRSYAQVSSRYTKPVLACRPITWGSGFHRIKWRNFRIDPHLFLFHFGLVDYERTKKKVDSSPLKASGWKGHFDRRLELFELIANAQPHNGDECFRRARRLQSCLRPLYALNKPGTGKKATIVLIPERFKRCYV